jgi:hypothetical protein
MSRSKRSLATEFVIVTLGVGLALGADSAVERYRDRAAARNALAAVRRDVGADIDQLAGRLGRLEEGFEARRRLSAFAEDRAEIQDSVRFVDDLTLLLDYLTFDANTAAIEALKSSGRIDLISNDELREALLDYLNSVENTAEGDVARRHAILGYSEGLLPRLVEGTEWSGRGRSEADRRAWAAGALNSRVMKESGALRELLLLTSSPLGWQSFLYRRALAEAEELAQLLDNEIGAG